MRLTNEAEYEAAKKVVDDAEHLASIFWCHSQEEPHPTPFRYAKIHAARMCWTFACYAASHYRDEDPDEAAELCAEYRANPKFNPDPSSAYKNHTLNDE